MQKVMHAFPGLQHLPITGCLIAAGWYFGHILGVI